MHTEFIKISEHQSFSKLKSLSTFVFYLFIVFSWLFKVAKYNFFLKFLLSKMASGAILKQLNKNVKFLAGTL